MNLRDEQDELDSWWEALNQDERYIYEQEQEMKTGEMIQSKYLKALDFDEDGQTVTIKGVRQENVGKDNDPDDNRWVIYYRELPKGQVLNVTAIRLLEHIFGDETENWKGKQLIIYNDPTIAFAGKITGGIRLRQLPKAQTQKPAAEPTADKDFDDDIPF